MLSNEGGGEGGAEERGDEEPIGEGALIGEGADASGPLLTLTLALEEDLPGLGTVVGAVPRLVLLLALLVVPTAALVLWLTAADFALGVGKRATSTGRLRSQPRERWPLRDVALPLHSRAHADAQWRSPR